MSAEQREYVHYLKNNNNFVLKYIPGAAILVNILTVTVIAYKPSRPARLLNKYKRWTYLSEEMQDRRAMDPQRMSKEREKEKKLFRKKIIYK